MISTYVLSFDGKRETRANTRNLVREIFLRWKASRTYNCTTEASIHHGKWQLWV